MATDSLRPNRSRPHTDEDTDQIGSSGSTPPQAATPRPDLIDKRLPGIVPTYFGQVRAFVRSSSPKSESAPPPSPPSTTTTTTSTTHNSPPRPQAQPQEIEATPRASCSLTATSYGSSLSPLLLPHERLALTSTVKMPHQESTALAYSYTPTSSTSSNSSATSLRKLQRDDSSESGYGTGSGSDSSAPSTHAGSQSADSPLLQACKDTTTHTRPLTSIITSPCVSAVLSNPAQSPPSPICDLMSMADITHHNTIHNQKLTEGVKNTPPQTPRSRSHEGKQQPSNLSHTTTHAKLTSTHGNTIGPVLGKLSVGITAGRGLRPSSDAYVVCQFQWAESISDGPKRDVVEHLEPAGGMAMRRTDSEGRPRAIPMKSRQSSNTGMAEMRDLKLNQGITDPVWNHEAIFDVVGAHSELEVSVYDRANNEAFLGHVKFCPTLVEYDTPYDRWFSLQARDTESGDGIAGEIRLQLNFRTTEKKHYGPTDFQMLKLIGKGTFGQVFQVQKKDTKRIYAMKVLSKKVIVQKKEVAHTLGERNILVRTAMADSPFIVALKFSFQTPDELFLVTDYMSGGELFWHLQKEGRFQEHRAKFYIAELILALQHLHDHDIVYRDLKPENILLDANGHIALCDFGLSKANLTDDSTTNTFCGTTEYLAPEVLLDEHGYTKMVDFWSLGVLVFEMCCGWSPFYAEDTQQMYKNIAFGKVRFPRDALSADGRNFVKGLLNRNPKHRLGAKNDAAELKAHEFFKDINWEELEKKNLPPPFKPQLKSELDVSNFDPEFTNAGTSALNARAAAMASGANPSSTPLSPTVQANFKGFTFVDENSLERQFADREEELDRMDEDERENDPDWDKPFGNGGQRMSGVVHSNDPDEGMFGHGQFEP
ncbi:kinase-like protein [Aulographum hederae CBS 113979]|uniref:non-specific serine/threonine protein kinase n=1 Tax=Aulographum hederae CBS 113979 TaxID=1176131 RepID=A0A6G1H1N7_9PEZI|nr:kinase-like protein [Aulographum hederae CBS 113979]